MLNRFAEVTRGGQLESCHAGALVIATAAGDILGVAGANGKEVFPRSSIKLIQALPLIETGAADRYAMGEGELALACASHVGSPRHVAMVSRLLERTGLAAGKLACGPQFPLDIDDQRALLKSGVQPTALHNNCSGKHAGFLCTACHQGYETSGYVRAQHQIQRQVRQVLEELTGASIAEEHTATDGCSIPTYALPLRSLARAFARAATGEGLVPSRAAAARRLMQACIDHPWFTAGTNRMCTKVMLAGQGAIFAKTGADGVYTAAVPEKGIGIAIKCDDGSTPATETAMIAALTRVFAGNKAMQDALAPLATKAIKTRKGDPVGELRPTFTADGSLPSSS